MSDTKMIVITFKAPRRLLKEIDRVAERLSYTRSHLIRVALAEYLSKNGSKKIAVYANT